jgi:hypothetical protein
MESGAPIVPKCFLGTPDHAWKSDIRYANFSLPVASDLERNLRVDFHTLLENRDGVVISVGFAKRP